MYHVPVYPLADRVLQHIRKHELLQAGDRVGVAVSGGIDSVALLRLLLELRNELDFVFVVFPECRLIKPIEHLWLFLGFGVCLQNTTFLFCFFEGIEVVPQRIAYRACKAYKAYRALVKLCIGLYTPPVKFFL